MSEIKTKNQNWAVDKKEDVFDLYLGASSNKNLKEQTSKIGMEVEYNLYDQETLKPLTEDQSACFIRKGREKAISINKEPSATMLEILSDPYRPQEFAELITQIDRRFEEFWGLGEETGFLPSPFGYLPHVKPHEHHQTRNDRYKAMWMSGRKDLVEPYHSFVDPSIQVSVSYKDFDHLLRIVRLAIVLEPFLILTTEADPGFYEGSKINGSPRTRVLSRRGRNGGIPDFYYSAKSGEELIDAHIDHCLNNEHIFVCWNHDGALITLPEQKWVRFSDLERDGYGPKDLLNYRQAQSENWRRTVNIAEIRDDEGTLFGHRAEISSLFCTGLQHQRHSAAVLSCLIAYCGHFYDGIRTLSKDFGIDLDNLDSSRTALEANFLHAYDHQGRYHDLPFGTKTIKDFALGFSDIIQSCLKGWKLDQFSKPLQHILHEGRPDWLVYREIFNDINVEKDYLKVFLALSKTHPQLICPDHCADFTKDIMRSEIQKFSAQ